MCKIIKSSKHRSVSEYVCLNMSEHAKISLTMSSKYWYYVKKQGSNYATVLQSLYMISSCEQIEAYLYYCEALRCNVRNKYFIDSKYVRGFVLNT